MENLTQIECDREIKKIRRTINILIILNLCPVYAGSGHSSLNLQEFPKAFLNVLTVKSHFGCICVYRFWYGVDYMVYYSAFCYIQFHWQGSLENNRIIAFKCTDSWPLICVFTCKWPKWIYSFKTFIGSL